MNLFPGEKAGLPPEFPAVFPENGGVLPVFSPALPRKTFLDLPPRGTFILEIMEPWLPKTERTWDTDPEKGRDVSLSNHFVHPYMPNSVPAIEAEMLREVGVKDVAEIYRSVIPEDLLFPGEMDLPEPILSEQALKRHMNALLAQNTSTAEALSFLGAGCYKRYIPAVCDEIANRSEFLTAYCGDTYSDHGKMQAIFEYASMMAELLELDVVSYPTYDAGQAVSSSFRMAFRLRPDRKEILIPAHMSPEIRSQAEAYCAPFGTLVPVADPGGILDLEDLKAKLSENTAAVFLENPSFLGVFQPKAREVMDLAHQAGALGIVMPEVSSLGVMDPPARYGADLTCGDIQPLGIHMQYGSGCAGFIAMDNDPALVNELPTYLYGICETGKEGQYGWGRALYYRNSHASREKAKEYFGTECGLWAIVAGCYLATMGPQGMQELGARILAYAAYAQQKLAALPGVKVNPAPVFQEFVVDFSATGKTVAEINAALLERNIFGGVDLGRAFPDCQGQALYCVSDTTTAADIDTLYAALAAILGGSAQ